MHKTGTATVTTALADVQISSVKMGLQEQCVISLFFSPAYKNALPSPNSASRGPSHPSFTTPALPIQELSPLLLPAALGSQDKPHGTTATHFFHA